MNMQGPARNMLKAIRNMHSICTQYARNKHALRKIMQKNYADRLCNIFMKYAKKYGEM
jgi:hypothetical protein